jgi:hypothetical protein
MILMAKISPAGVESSVFALVTSLQMVGQTVSGSISSEFTQIWVPDLTDFSQLWKLTLFTGGVRCTEYVSLRRVYFADCCCLLLSFVVVVICCCCCCYLCQR